MLATPLVCLSLMIFFALSCQCMSTLAADIGRRRVDLDEDETVELYARSLLPYAKMR